MRWLGACVFAAALAAGAARAADPAQASSDDGRWRVVAEGQTVAVYEQGVRLKTLVATARDGRNAPSAIAAIHSVPARRSFVIAFETLAELWELSIDPQAAPILEGLVHDFRQGEALAEPGFLGVRRTRLDQPLHELVFDDSGAYVIGRSWSNPAGPTALVLVQLDIRRAIGRFEVPGDPGLAQARTVHRDGLTLLLVPDRQGGPTTVVDLRRARLIERDRGVELPP
jgi:hypothetical protein